MESAERGVGRPGPRVTIVTATFNAAATVAATLASVAEQTVRDLEHIVVDGGSTDGTLGIVRAAAPAARVVADFDHGIYDAFNRGLALARGEWVSFLNADDAYAGPRTLEQVLAAADAEPAAELLVGDADLVAADGRVVRQVRLGGRLRLDADNEVCHQATFMRREALLRLGGFDATYALAGDYDLLLRALAAGIRPRFVPHVLAAMRAGGRSADERAVRLEFMRAWRRRTGRLPWRLLLRFVKAHVLDVHAPAASALLGAAKRRVWPRG